MNEIFEEMNKSIDNFYKEANEVIGEGIRRKVKSGEWKFYIQWSNGEFNYYKLDNSGAFTRLNSKLIEEYGVY